MNTLTLSIGQTYIYTSNNGSVEVSYLGPFGPIPDAWHDFAVRSACQDEIITVSARAIGEQLTVVDNGQLKVDSEENYPEVAADGAGAIVESGQLKVESGQLKVESGQLKVESGQLKVESGQLTVDSERDIPELKMIDITFTSRGGRLMNHTIEGTCARNIVLHAYSFLYREASRGASGIRIHAAGRMVDIRDIREFTPLTLLYQLSVDN